MQTSDSQPCCLIGLDLGTSAVKGVLLQSDGQVLKTAVHATHHAQPKPDRVEQDALQQYQEMTTVIRELAGYAPTPVKALAAAAASGNTLLADEYGNPLCPVINWMDKRCVGHLPAALTGLTSDAVREVTGWPCVEQFPLAHLAWLQEHEQVLYRSATRVCMNTDWLLFRLTNRWMTDASTATTFHLRHQVNRVWHQPFLERLGLRENQLSPVTGSGVAVGPLTDEAAAACGLTTGTLVATGCFDHPAGARASRILATGQLMLSCGTSWVGFTPFHDRQTILDAGMLCDPFLSENGGPWAGIFSVPAIGPVIDWYVNNLIAPGEENRWEIFNECAAQAPAGAEGLIIDLLAPPQPVEADRSLLSRAVMESAVRALNAHLLRLKQHGFSFNRAVLVGGPSKSSLWPRIITDMTGLDLTIGSPHAGAIGAALLAANAARIPVDKYHPFDPSDRPDK